MVDAPDPAGLVGEDVPALAVRVVDDAVEDGHADQCGDAGVRQHHGAPVAVLRVQHLPPAVGHPPGSNDGDLVPGAVLVDPELAHPGAAGSVLPPHGRRNQVPPERLGHLEGGQLTARQRPVGEVPQRTLPRHRLEDTPNAAAVLGSDDAAQRRVGRVTKPPLDLELALAQQWAQRRVAQPHRGRHARRRYPLARGQMCPAGSSGWLQKGQGGRPADTTVRARSAKARA